MVSHKILNYSTIKCKCSAFQFEDMVEGFSAGEGKRSDNKEKDESFEPGTITCPYFLNQLELDDHSKDLDLNKSRDELLGSWLNKWNLLGKDC